MAKALMGPFDHLLANCGEDPAEIYGILQPYVVNQTKPSQTIFDAESHKLVNATDVGIIEPAKVCRVALGNALSVASLLTTLGGIVTSPRNAGLEQQLELSKSAYKEIMSASTGHVGQE